MSVPPGDSSQRHWTDGPVAMCAGSAGGRGCSVLLASAPSESGRRVAVCVCRVPGRPPLYTRRRRGLANGLNGAADKQRHSAHSCAPRRAARPAPRRRRRPGAALTPDSRIPPSVRPPTLTHASPPPPATSFYFSS